MIQRTNGTCLVLHRGKYRVTYYENGKRKQKFTGTSKLFEAMRFRDKFLKGAITKTPSYIYKQGKKWLVQVKGRKLGRFSEYEKALEVRDGHLKTEKQTKGIK